MPKSRRRASDMPITTTDSPRRDPSAASSPTLGPPLAPTPRHPGGGHGGEIAYAGSEPTGAARAK
jgi:hypothetical protein